MDSIRASEAPDPGSIPGEATYKKHQTLLANVEGLFYAFLISDSLKNLL